MADDDENAEADETGGADIDDPDVDAPDVDDPDVDDPGKDEIDADEIDEDEDEDEEEEEPDHGFIGRVFAFADRVGKRNLILAGSGIGIFMLMITGIVVLHMVGGDPGKAEALVPGPPIRHEVAPISADLKSDKCRSGFIRVTFMVEISGTHNIARMEEMEEQILDEVILYLRDHTSEQLRVKNGTEKLRKGLMGVYNKVMAPERIVNILFKDLIIR